MILKQHLDIDGLEFDIAIRKPPPVDEAGGKELDAWMRIIVVALEETKALSDEFTAWEQLSDEALLNFEQQMSARTTV